MLRISFSVPGYALSLDRAETNRDWNYITFPLTLRFFQILFSELGDTFKIDKSRLQLFSRFISQFI